MTSCINGGSCLHDNENKTFSCSCKQPWTGDKCEVKKGNQQIYFIFNVQMSNPHKRWKTNKILVTVDSWRCVHLTFHICMSTDRNFYEEIKEWRGVTRVVYCGEASPETSVNRMKIFRIWTHHSRWPRPAKPFWQNWFDSSQNDTIFALRLLPLQKYAI